MKTLKIVVSFFVLALVFSVSTVYSELLKEGSGPYRGAKSSKNEILKMEGGRFQLNMSQLGVVVDAPEDSPFENATFKYLGSLHSINGQYEGSGFTEWTRPNGDKIYATSKFQGVLRKELNSVHTLVGGTGTCQSIQGTLELGYGPPVKSAQGDIRQAISIGVVTWKIP